MLRNKVYLVLGLCLLLILILFSACFYFTEILMDPGHLQCENSHNVFCGDPSMQGLIFQSFNARSRDGVNISGWWIFAPNSRKVVILSHGRGNDRREGMRFAKALVEGGFNVIAFDYRNSGNSPPSFNSLGFFEKLDLEGILDYIQPRGFESIGIYGFSQGAATAISVMASDLRIKAGVFEGAFSSAIEVIAEKALSDYFLPQFPIVDLAISLFKYRTGADLNSLNPKSDIARIRPRPIYLVHSKGDQVVEFHHAEKLLAKYPQAETWFFDDYRHVESWQYERSTAERRVVNFFTKTLSQIAGSSP